MVEEGRQSSSDDRNTSTPSSVVHPILLDEKGIFINKDLEIKQFPSVINEGRLLPKHNVVSMMGKGKETMEILGKKNPASFSSPYKKLLSSMANDLEASSSTGLKLKDMNRLEDEDPIKQAEDLKIASVDEDSVLEGEVPVSNFPIETGSVDESSVLLKDDVDAGNATVNKLISEGKCNIEELERCGRDLMDLICNIKICLELNEDRLELIQITSGKSISTLATLAMEEFIPNQVYWKWINKAKLNARVENFWWRLFNNALPIFQFLSYRRLQTDNLCPRGHNEIEDLNHVNNRCKNINEVLCHLNEWGFGIQSCYSFNERCKWLADQNSFMINLFCYSVYLSWKDRSGLVHEKMEKSSIFIASKAIRYAAGSKSFIPQILGLLVANQLMLLDNS
ncbi:hypothetical protein MA16_Dca023538 [Dendrobium catenatum]|uniref:Reverse transcriptase zinc-binding domain-containing protein n=1 Tax=Dendrobium catenatum TaxID=906689 RepID=A0A2I0XB71_9ASPA|nr:hypothetical protein MA16_Dca023538 [Dendrobium catenatum]